MKYLKRFNESIEEYWDADEIEDFFHNIIDEGFRLEDVKIGTSLTIAPKLWCNSHHDFTGEKFPSLTVSFLSSYRSGYETPKYDLSILDVLDECIKHFESFYKVKLDSIYIVGLPTTDYQSSGAMRTTIYNWFNSCQTIKDINKVHNDELKTSLLSPRLTQSRKDEIRGLIDKLTITRFDLTFNLSK